jgi:HlyD family secretion protein
VLNGTVKIEVTLTSELPKSARPDLSVEGRIELERRPDVVHVERPVSSREDAPMEIFRIARADGVAERRLVRLGRSSVTTIEILDGLEPGDEIILSDMSKYESDDRIRLR